MSDWKAQLHIDDGNYFLFLGSRENFILCSLNLTAQKGQLKTAKVLLFLYQQSRTLDFIM